MRAQEKNGESWIQGNQLGVVLIIGFMLYFMFLLLFICSGQKADSLTPVKIKTEHRKIPDNSIYFELLGNSIMGSLNYERLFVNGHDFYLSGRLGTGYIPGIFQSVSFPVMMTGMYQVSNNFLFELGIGGSLQYTFWQNYISGGGFFGDGGGDLVPGGSFYDPLIIGFAGMRVQGKKGFLFRFGFTPVYALIKNTKYGAVYSMNDRAFLPWFGLSFGYSFGKRK